MSRKKSGDSFWNWFFVGVIIYGIVSVIERHKGLKIFFSFLSVAFTIWIMVLIISFFVGPHPPQYLRKSWTNTEYAFDDESADAYIEIGYSKIKLYNNTDALLFGKKVRWKYDSNTDTISFTYKGKYNFKITPESRNGDVYLDDVNAGNREAFADVLKVDINGAILFFTPTKASYAKALTYGQEEGKAPKPKNIFREIDAGNVITSINPNTKQEVKSLPHSSSSGSNKSSTSNDKWNISDNLSDELKGLVSPLFGDKDGVASKDIEEQQYVRKFIINYNNFAKYKIDRVDWIDEDKAVITINGKDFEVNGYDYGCSINCIILNGLSTVDDYKIILMDMVKTLDSTITDSMFNKAYETAKSYRAFAKSQEIKQPYRLINDNVGIKMFYFESKSPTHEGDSFDVLIDNILPNDPSMQFLKEQQ